MSDLRNEAKEQGATGVYLVLSRGDYAVNGTGIDLCLDCAERRGLTLYSDISFISDENGYACEIVCADCGCHIASPQ